MGDFVIKSVIKILAFHFQADRTSGTLGCRIFIIDLVGVVKGNTTTAEGWRKGAGRAPEGRQKDDGRTAEGWRKEGGRRASQHHVTT